jgi:transcriptional regulator with XRE-family HTH domain
MASKDPITETLKETRIKRGLSVLELAEVLNIPADRIYKWDQGKSAPKFEDRAKVDKWLAGKNFQQEKPSQGHNGHNTSPGYVPAEDLIQVLKEQNEFLRRNFETSLITIMESQALAGVQLKSLSWFSVLQASGGDSEKAEKMMTEINNRIAAYEGIENEGGNLNRAGKRYTSGKGK